MDESIPVEYDKEFESEFETKETNQKDIFEKSVPVLITILASLASLYYVYKLFPSSVFIFCVILGIIIHFYLWISGKREKFWW